MFQPKVVQEYVEKNLSVSAINDKYDLSFAPYFKDPKIQGELEEYKEEQFQEGFLRKLFCEILGYAIGPRVESANLVPELKNEDNQQKVDAGIIVDGEVVGVVELKSTKTKNLDSVVSQAFSYKNHHPKARVVVVSNFQKLRFYIDYTGQYEEFDLFTLTRDDFKKLWVYLSWDSIRNGVPFKLLEDSREEEKAITEKFYRDYSTCKEHLFNNILANNRQFDKLVVFQKTQKLLDRLLFIYFGRDSRQIESEAIDQIELSRLLINSWSNFRVSLYDQFRVFFGKIDIGSEIPRVFGYDGGLFRPDPVLDEIQIDDEVLRNVANKLGEYDFASQVDVDILGRIFEHSLTEIEEITRQIEAEQNGFVSPETAQKSKRKSDGVFYTPSYITDYIVEASLGKLCEEKKQELGINQETFDAIGDKKKISKAERERLGAILSDYREWLLGLTICDPACGSGAFLNAALKFLKSEHQKVEEWTRLVRYGKEDVLAFQDLEIYILENNLFGVDVNEESVEITRLALWLRTCRKDRKLNDLSANIKCGDSLIDDPKLSSKAFDWRKEFPQVFAQGGFDVVIGNPPYVQLQKNVAQSENLAKCGYETYNKGGDLYCLFVERGYSILKKGGIQSFIIPNKWTIARYGAPLRKYLADKCLLQLLNFGDVQFFSDATIYCLIFAVAKRPPVPEKILLSVNAKTYKEYGGFSGSLERRYVSEETFGAEAWTIRRPEHVQVLAKLAKVGTRLKDMPVLFGYGVKTGFNEAFIIDEETKSRLINDDPNSADLIRPIYRGQDIWKYCSRSRTNRYLIATFPTLNVDIDKYPALKKYLSSFGNRLSQTGEKGTRKLTGHKWCETQDAVAYYRDFAEPKIIYANISSFFPFLYDDQERYCNDTCFILRTNDNSVSLKYLTAFFNSKITRVWIWYHCTELMGGTRKIHKAYFENIPVPDPGDKRQWFEETVDKRIAAYNAARRSGGFLFDRLREDFPNVKITERLDSFQALEFEGFLAELKKQKFALSLKAREEWREYFAAKRQETSDALALCDRLDAEIESAVADLCGFDETERETLREFWV